MRYNRLKSIILLEYRGLDVALEWLEKAIALNPEKIDLHHLKLNLFMSHDSGDHKLDEKALIEVERLIKKFPQHQDHSINWKGFILYKMKRFEESLPVFESLLDKDYCNRKGVLNNIAIILANLGRKEESIRRIEELINESQNDDHLGNYYDSYGEILMIFNEYQSAINIFERALEIAMEDPHKGWFLTETCLKMGRCYIELGDYKQAREFIEKGKELTEKLLPGNRDLFDHNAEKYLSQINELEAEKD